MVFGERDVDDLQDRFQAVRAATGEPLWSVSSVAIGKLDYGNSPRATPLVAGDRAFLSGAFGDLTCVALDSGRVVWRRNLRKEFSATAELPWGYCGSPLLVDGKLIVAPGGPQASVVALDPRDGRTLWKAPGAAPGHGSFIAGKFGGRWQAIGHDADSLGGWDVATGERIWRLEPRVKGDFNVPTPIAYRGELIVVTENNGARRYRFEQGGKIVPEPVAENARLAPDMSSPVVSGERLFCVHRLLYCLDLRAGLREVRRERDPAYGDYAALIADDRRLLVIGRGELVLLDSTADPPRIVSRARLWPEQVDVYAHPALVGRTLYVRGETSLRRLSLE